MSPHFVYLALLVASLAGPLALSFDKKVAFYRQWPAVWPALVIPAIVFIVWDVWFNEIGVWSFSDTYTLGLRLWGLPVEEWLFFLVVPYCSLFVYEVLKHYFPRAGRGTWSRYVSIGMLLFFLIMVITAEGKIYTTVNFLFAAVVLLFTLLQHIRGTVLGFFLLAWTISLIPKLIVNGILTSLPVVIYNAHENIGIRIGTIPMEDFFYFFGLLLLNVLIYEGLGRKQNLTSHTQPGT